MRNIIEMFAFRRSHNPLRIHENRRGTGEIQANTVFSVQQTCEATKNRPWLIIIPFRINLESFPIQKLFIFVVFSLSYNVEKSIKDCSTGNCPLARDYKTAAPLVNHATWRYPSRDSCGSTWSNQCHFLSSKTLLTYPISACVAKCSFSSMKRIKTSLYVIRWQMSAFHPWRFYIVHLTQRCLCW